jgi:hypothetical protein
VKPSTSVSVLLLAAAAAGAASPMTLKCFTESGSPTVDIVLDLPIVRAPCSRRWRFATRASPQNGARTRNALTNISQLMTCASSTGSLKAQRANR